MAWAKLPDKVTYMQSLERGLLVGWSTENKEGGIRNRVRGLIKGKITQGFVGRFYVLFSLQKQGVRGCIARAHIHAIIMKIGESLVLPHVIYKIGDPELFGWLCSTLPKVVTGSSSPAMRRKGGGGASPSLSLWLGHCTCCFCSWPIGSNLDTWAHQLQFIYK